MKSPALSEALKPLQRLVAEAHDAYREKMKAYEFDQVAVKAQKALLQDKLKKALRDGTAVEALRAEFDALETPAPTERRYLVNDSRLPLHDGPGGA